VDAGDRARALEAIDAALAIDPDFLAAHSLRDNILAPPEAGGHMGPPLQADQGHLEAQTSPSPGGDVGASPDGDVGADSRVGPRASRPLVSSEGYAKFEARAKRRRVDRRIDAARSALERRRLKDAAIALDEIIELDPNLPELPELTASFDALRRADVTTRRGPWVAAAASFAMVLFGATLFQRPLASVQTAGMSTLVETAPPRPLVETAIVDVSVAVPTSGQSETGKVPVATDHATVSPEPAVAEPPVLPRTQPVAPPEPVPPPAPAPIAPPPAPGPALVPLSSSAFPHAPDAVDEVGLVKQALQRYRSAYDGLDAQSAQAVYPAVNQAALARAFDGLESQTLTFDACDVQLRGEAAIATCRGSARYVPKIGSREPRTEPRVWNFSLRKAGDDWKIDSARAER